MAGSRRAQMSGTKGIIGMVILVIVVVVLISVIGDLQDRNTTFQAVTNEALTASNSTAQSLANADLASNATCNCTPYFTNLAQGTVLVSNDTCNGQALTCSYSYKDAIYVESSVARTILGQNVILYTVFAFMLIIGGLFYYKMR